MATTVKLQTGDSIATEEEPQALANRFDGARNEGTLVKLDSAAGPIWINPHALVTISRRRKCGHAIFQRTADAHPRHRAGEICRAAAFRRGCCAKSPGC